MSGDYYLFVNLRRTGCKVLLWDGTGLCIFMKSSNAAASPILGARATEPRCG